MSGTAEAVGARADAEMPDEAGVEVRKVAKADFERDIRNAIVAGAQAARRLPQARCNYVAVRCLACHTPIDPQEMKRTHAGLRGEILE